MNSHRKSSMFIELLLLILFFSLSFAQAPDTLWTKTFGGTAYDDGNSIQQTFDGGYIIAGLTYSFGQGTPDYCNTYLIKINKDGDTLWTKVYELPFYDAGCSVQQTSDSGFIIAGPVGQSQAQDAYLIKTDRNGDTLWTRRYSSSGDDDARCVQQTPDGGYIIAGSHSGPAIIYNFHLIKTDSIGDTLWTKSFGGPGFDFAYSVDQTTDGGYIIGGLTDPNGGESDIYLVKTDSLGDSLWTKTYGGSNSDYAWWVQQTSDGGYVIVGNTTSFGAGNEDIYIVKTDSLGDTLWTRTYGGFEMDTGNSIQQTFDGGYIIAGSTLSYGAGQQDAYLIKVDANGDSVWANVFGEIRFDYFNSVQQTFDSGYVAVGYKNASPGDVYVVRIASDSFYIEETSITLNRHDNLSTTIINGSLLLPRDKKCRVFDITGRVVIPQHIGPGIYFIEVDGKITRKVVKLR